MLVDRKSAECGQTFLGLPTEELASYATWWFFGVHGHEGLKLRYVAPPVTFFSLTLVVPCVGQLLPMRLSVCLSAIGGSNAMTGYSDLSDSSSSFQQDVAARCLSLVDARVDETRSEGSFRQLLKGANGYETQLTSRTLWHCCYPREKSLVLVPI